MTTSENVIKNVEDTISNALDVIVPEAMDVMQSTGEVIKVQMVDTGLWWGMSPLVAIACLMALIAVMNLVVLVGNYCLEKKRRNHELFDKRYPVYEAARNLLSTLTLQGQLHDKEIEAYRMEILDADLLYSEEIREYLMKIRDDAIEWIASEKSGKFEDAARQRKELISELLDRKLYKKLEPFLSLE